MSIEDLSAFFEKLQSDEDLRQKAVALQDSDDPERLDGLCRLAAENGFQVTPADWEHEAAAPAVEALSKNALGEVVGAGCAIGPMLLEQDLGEALGSCGAMA